MQRFVSDEEIVQLFSFHPAETDEVREAHAYVRYLCLDMAKQLQRILPECPQKTVAIRQKLVEVMTTANQAIAIHGVPEK